MFQLVSSNCLWAVDSDGRAAGAKVTLGSNDLVVVLTKSHALAGPRIEVGLHVDRTAGALVLTNRPVLLKGRGTINGWLVGASALGNFVRAAVDGDGTLVLGLRRGVVCTEVLNDVVLNKRVASPAVDGKVGVAVGVVGTRVGDGTSRSRVPSLSTNEVTTAAPLNTVRTGVAVCISDLRATIGPLSCMLECIDVAIDVCTYPAVVAAVVSTSG
jgi:hypothetical protein